MGFLSRQDKGSELNCSLTELEDKLAQERDNLQDLTDLKGLISRLFNEFNRMIMSLSKFTSGDSMGSTNNSRMVIRNLIMPYLTVAEPVDFNKLRDFINNTNSLFDQAVKAGLSKGSRVTAFFKGELKDICLRLVSLNKAFIDLKKIFNERDYKMGLFQSAISEVVRFQGLIKHCDSCSQEKRVLLKKKDELLSKRELLKNAADDKSGGSSIVKVNSDLMHWGKAFKKVESDYSNSKSFIEPLKSKLEVAAGRLLGCKVKLEIKP